MSRRGIHLYPYVRSGGRYTSGQQLVSSSYGTAVSTGPAPSFNWTGDIWGLAGVWSTGTQ